jgi:ankyrin repeat protein
VDYKRNMGVFRTPLQRAAEMGYFDIVQYLIEQGAAIDTVSIHPGGTALQLAALNGFCGIATFLLEQGADPNHPPAKSNG